MKLLFPILLLITGLASFSQSAEAVGDYKLKIATADNNLFEYELALSPDGSFTFHYHSNIKNGFPPEVDKYGKGKWTIANNMVFFTTDKKDIDAKYTLDFSDSKARFFTKSPRDASDKVIKTRIKFVTSEISWMKGIEVSKV